MSVEALKIKVKSRVKVTLMPARSSPSHFSISPTCGWAFGDSAGTCYHVEYTQHPALNTVYYMFDILIRTYFDTHVFCTQTLGIKWDLDYPMLNS